MNRVALLDVNFLIALFDADHIHHETAHDWFADHRSHGWATCPLTEAGFIRVTTSSSYGGTQRAGDVIARLRRFCQSGDHTFWAATLSLQDDRVFDAALIRGSRQITDIYLLGLAVRMNGCLTTFDRGIPLSAVIGATREHLSVIAPVDPGHAAPAS